MSHHHRKNSGFSFWFLGLFSFFLLVAPALFSSNGPTSNKVFAPRDEFPFAHYQAKLEDNLLVIEVEHQTGYHTYTLGNEERGGASPSTRFELLEGLIAKGDWQEPQAKDLYDIFQVADWGYEKSVQFRLPVEVLPEAKQAVIGISGQVCGKGSCYPFQNLRLILPLQGNTVSENAGNTATSSPSDKTEILKNKQKPEASSSNQLRYHKGRWVMEAWGGAGDLGSAQSWREFILICIGGGLIALLMPCVFPMIPITISFFSKQGEEKKASSVGLGLLYGLGVMSSYTLLGLLLTLTLGATGVSDFGNSSWVALGIALFFTLFGLSMLGVFEFRLPSSINQKLNLQGRSQGVLGALLLGGTFAVTSMACTIPIVGGILALALSGEILKPLIGMLVYSGTIALPFIGLSALPRLLRKLPKAGGWMNNLKVVFGFIELAAAAEFLGWARIISREMVLAVWVAAALLSALYLLGIFRTKYDAPLQGLSGGRIVLVLFFASIGLWVSTGLFGGSLGPIEAFLIHPESGKWEVNPELEKVLSDARQKDQNVFLDFTGSSCANCRLFERSVLETEWAEKELQNFRLLRLYIDDPEHGESYTDFTYTLFNQIGSPQYVIINSEGRITAYENKVEAYVSINGLKPQGKERFFQLISSVKNKGKAFDFEKGFLKEDKATLQ